MNMTDMEGWEMAINKSPDRKMVRFVKKQKRKIFQDIKVSYEPIELMFDFVKQKQPELDCYEKAY